MLLGIICTVTKEIDRLTKNLSDLHLTKLGLRDYYSGKLYGKPVVIVYCHRGKVDAASTASMLVEHFQVSNLVLIGLAGALHKKIAIGDIVVADGSFQYDVDLDHLSGTFMDVPLMGMTNFRLDKEWSNKIREILKDDLSQYPLGGITIHEGVVASGNSFVASEDRVKHIIKKNINANCVEMEAAAVAQIGYEYSTPTSVISIISDYADRNAPDDYNSFMSHYAEPICHEIIFKILKEI